MPLRYNNDKRKKLDFQGVLAFAVMEIVKDNIEYVFDCIDKNTTEVGNIKAYLLAALYNAPATMDSYYRAEVNHDLYGSI